VYQSTAARRTRFPIALSLVHLNPLQEWEEGDGDYVAPELLAAGSDATPAADLFSLGATLYEVSKS